MHNRANYKANLRALVVSWNQAAGDEDNIDFDGFTDAVTFSGMPLRLRHRRDSSGQEEAPLDAEEADEAGGVPRHFVCVQCEDSARPISTPVHACAQCEGVMHGSCGRGLPDDEMKRVCTKCDKQGLYDSGTFLSRTIYQPDNPSVLPVV